MVAPFPVTVSFPGDDDGRQAWIGHMDAQGRRQGSSVQAIKKITFEIVRQFGGLPDARDQATLVGALAQCRQGCLEGFQYPEIWATGAPLGRNIVLVVVDFYHFSASTM
jgi:hypothetical protein